MGDKHIITNIYRTQAYDSRMCEYFCIQFIDFMLIYFHLSIMRRMTK